jgi:hypothetical protein
MAVEVGQVTQYQEGGHGFSIKATPAPGKAARWLHLIYETEADAKEGRTHAVKAVEKARAAQLPI